MPTVRSKIPKHIALVAYLVFVNVNKDSSDYGTSEMGCKMVQDNLLAISGHTSRLAGMSMQTCPTDLAEPVSRRRLLGSYTSEWAARKAAGCHGKLPLDGLAEADSDAAKER